MLGSKTRPVIEEAFKESPNAHPLPDILSSHQSQKQTVIAISGEPNIRVMYSVARVTHFFVAFLAVALLRDRALRFVHLFSHHKTSGARVRLISLIP